MKYIYDKSDKTWKTGTSNCGIGIFKENGKWEANVVVSNIYMIKTCNSFKEAKQEAEETFKRVNE